MSPARGTGYPQSVGQGALAVRCALCARLVPRCVTSVHHLLPRAEGGRLQHCITLCKICHAQLHATFPNRVLAASYSSLERLRQDPDVRRFLRWVRKQKPHRKIKVSRRSDRRPVRSG